MVGMPQKKIEYHLNPKELNKCINKKEKEVEVLRKLYVIKDLYKMKKPENICKKRGISLPTLHRWWDLWNEEGYEGLFPKYYNSGRHSKLSFEDKKKLNDILENEEYLNQKRVAKIIKDEFGVVYCESQQSVILRELGFRYNKPYQFYSKRPENAEEMLKKTYQK
ncbi:MAG: winged helix-turn-helix domain-containing protein [Methanobrevibacter sp.]|nr:winged helix-turn-helix domain-containing protein [Methanobrevibacter sp.]